MSLEMDDSDNMAANIMQFVMIRVMATVTTTVRLYWEGGNDVAGDDWKREGRAK